MALYSFTTTDIEEAAITAARLAAIAARPEPFADNAAFVDAYIRTHLLAPAVEAFVESRVHLVADAYRSATADDRARAEEALRVRPVINGTPPSRGGDPGHE